MPKTGNSEKRFHLFFIICPEFKLTSNNLIHQSAPRFQFQKDYIHFKRWHKADVYDS
jgi:hypothetical protein